MSDTHDPGKKRDRRFDQAQYDMLRRCSEKGDVTEWNEWRREHRSAPVLLEKADLIGAKLQGADLRKANLQCANLGEACLQNAELEFANLQGIGFISAKLQHAKLIGAKLQGASLGDTHLQGANLKWADLRGAKLSTTSMAGADCTFAIVDGETLLANGCIVDDKTDFTGVGLSSARIEPGLKTRLESNIRRKRWESWCRMHFWRWPALLFWWTSDYGRSTARIAKTFFAVALFFAALYWVSGLRGLDAASNGGLEPGVVSKLFVADGMPLPPHIVPVRALYFSIVTMTTLGFGDICANPCSLWGHILLIVQALLGYLLLAALVTRLAVLFTGSGPESE
jgi:hypothetical protein